jgi:asparagine synthase (glutamine-hydrolysing)
MSLPRNATLKRGVASLDTPERLRRYQDVLSLLPGPEIDGLFHDGIVPPATGDQMLASWRDYAPLMSEIDELTGFQFLELRSTLPDELLMYADKLTMAHSLEGRVPYLDQEIVEYAERLPGSFKVRQGKGKWLHRQVCKSFLPERILRRKKRGCAMNVVDDWFRSAKQQNREAILLDSNSQIYNFLRPEAVREMFREHQSGSSDHHKILFSIVVLEEWLRAQRSVETTAAV